jgi:hypothetical protein
MRRLRASESPDDNEVSARLLGAIIAREMEALDAPHVVVCRSLGSGTLTFIGPYPSGVQAMAVAQRDARAEQAAGHADIEYDVAPLFPPMG